MSFHTLNLSKQNLQTLPPDLPSIETINASSNALVTLNGLPRSLKAIDLSYNKLAFLGRLVQQCPFLEDLDVSNNRLISIEGLDNLKDLRRLVLAGNFIWNDQIALVNTLKELRVLDISSNQLDCDLQQLLGPLVNLQEFFSCSNEFKFIRFDYMNNLKRLVLDNNKIRTLEFGVCLRSLEVLSVAGNYLNNIDGLQMLPYLKEIVLDNNEFSFLEFTFNYLTRLSAKNNKIQSLGGTYAPKLERLEVAYNQLSSIEGLANVTHLDISHNYFMELPRLNPGLRHLLISHNKLRSLKNVNFYSYLETLVANDNCLTDIEDVYSLYSLKVLDLRGVYVDLQRFPNAIEFNGERLPNFIPFDEDKEEFFNSRAFENDKRSHSFAMVEEQKRILGNLNQNVHSKQSGFRNSPLKLSPIMIEAINPQTEISLPTFKKNFEEVPINRLDTFGGSSLKSTDSVFISSDYRYQEFFDEKQKELSERINRLERETKKLLNQEPVLFNIPETPIENSKNVLESELNSPNISIDRLRQRANKSIDSRLFKESLKLNTFSEKTKPYVPNQDCHNIERYPITRKFPSLDENTTPLRNSSMNMKNSRKGSRKDSRKDSKSFKTREENTLNKNDSLVSYLKTQHSGTDYEKNTPKTDTNTQLAECHTENISIIPRNPRKAKHGCSKHRRRSKHRRTRHRTITPSIRTATVQTELPTQSTPKITSEQTSYLAQTFNFLDSADLYSTNIKTPSDASGNKQEEANKELVSYSLTPPRPILTKEVDTNVIMRISSNAHEHSLVAKLLSGKNLRISKTYTHSIACKYSDDNLEQFAMMFYIGRTEEKMSAFRSSAGFKVLGNCHMFRTYDDSEICLLALVYCEIKNHEIVIHDPSLAIPVYLIEKF